MRIRDLFLVFMMLPAFCSFAQKQNPDSLLSLIKSAKNDSIRVKAYSSLCYIFRNSNSDTAIYYGNTGLSLAEKIKWEKGKSSCFKNLGIVNFESGQYERAIEYFMKSLKIDEKNKDQKGIASCYNFIGGVFCEQNRFEKAEEYYQKSMLIREKLNDPKGMATSYNNMGLIYYNRKNYSKALDYYSKSLKIKEGIGDKFGLAGSYNNVGMVHADLAHPKLAIEFYQKSLKIRNEIGDKKGISAVLGNISILNNVLADSTKNLAEKKKYFNEAINYGLKCMEISIEINALLWRNKAAEALQKAYRGIGNTSKSLEYAMIFIATNDSLFKEDKVKAIADVDAKYQTEKKEKQIELQKIQIEKKDAEVNQHRTFIYSISIVLFLVIVLLAVAGFAYSQKKKANKLLVEQKHEIEEKNEELNQQNEEILTQRDEIEKQRDLILERNEELGQKNEEISAQRDEIMNQRDILSNQNKILGEQKQEITDSITYAQRIQNALLPKDEIFRSVFNDFFIFFKPRNIVSGDFYWSVRLGDQIIFCVADCTGHGVPGAFMSMLGISFLNEITKKNNFTNVGRILDQLRDSVIEALHQIGNTYEQKDGMDIALCAYNEKSCELQYSGANNALYIVRDPCSNERVNENNETFTHVLPDKMPIGYCDKMSPFTNHTFCMQKGDVFFLCSDGFEDQFGGPKGKKFMEKQVKELLVSICNKPMSEQLSDLTTAFSNWKGDLEQIDDVTVLGFRV